MHPAISNCLVLKEIDHGPAVGGVHVEKNMIIGGLGHLAPLQFLIPGQDVVKIAIGADGGSLWDGNRLEIHRGGSSAKGDGGRVSGGRLEASAAIAAIVVIFVLGRHGREV